MRTFFAYTRESWRRKNVEETVNTRTEDDVPGEGRTGMSTTTSTKSCQLSGLDAMSLPLKRREIVLQMLRRIRRMTQRRWNYIVNYIWKLKHARPDVASTEDYPNRLLSPLKPGDTVWVRSQEEIRDSLTPWNELRGCGFMDEMAAYCNTRQRVFKRVEKFLDERDYLLKKANGIIILENVFCAGTKAFGPCDRSCFYFWREEWLEKIEEG
jgi:hypothetical protein